MKTNVLTHHQNKYIFLLFTKNIFSTVFAHELMFHVLLILRWLNEFVSNVRMQNLQ